MCTVYAWKVCRFQASFCENATVVNETPGLLLLDFSFYGAPNVF